jgi:NAD-dependent SIR2 family protein deacetylase
MLSSGRKAQKHEPVAPPCYRAHGELLTMNCWKCGQRVDTIERVGFHAHCPQCDRPLHVCRNCSLYDPAYNNQCRETMAERVVDKERSNFCEYFVPNVTATAPSSQPVSSRPSPERAAREQLDALFKKKSP